MDKQAVRLILGAAAAAMCAVSFARADDALYGTWSAPVDGETYNIAFDEHGGMSVVRANEPIVVAEYDAGNGELGITDLAGDEACGDGEREARYEYSLDGNLLHLNARDEPCAERARYLNGKDYRKKADLQEAPPEDPVE